MGVIGGRVGRWGLVLAGVSVLAALPSTLRLLPAADRDISAAALQAKIAGSAQAGYSGYAEAVGGLRLPLTDQFTALVDLFGQRTTLRVWWRGRDDWRVDSLTPTGENDVHRDARGTWSWDYEASRAVRAAEPPVRLPQPADLDPAALGRRLLAEADPAELTRLPARRVAGRDALGLRLHPADPHTTITRVDVWADADTGVPLRVEVAGAGADRPVVEAAYLDFSTGRPAARTVAFVPPRGNDVEVSGGSDDLAARLNRRIRIQPPDQLAGYRRRQRVEGLGAVGTYGRGVTVLAVSPLPSRIAEPLAEQLAKTPGVVKTEPSEQRSTMADGKTTLITLSGNRSMLLTVGPLSVMLVLPLTVDSPGWLLAGTVTPATLQQAADTVGRIALELP
ncbi:MAG: hypothetical protein V7637_3300 [Mycobacteriales bacterium]